MFVEDMQSQQVSRAGSKHMNLVSKSSMSEEGCWDSWYVIMKQ